jgi:hypothetical protein
MTTPEEFRVLIETPESTSVEFKTASGVSRQSKTQFGTIRMRCQPIITTNAWLHKLLPDSSKTQFDPIKTQCRPNSAQRYRSAAAFAPFCYTERYYP